MELPNRPSIDEMRTTAEPGPAARNGSEQQAADHHRGAEVHVEGGVPDLVVDGRPRSPARRPRRRGRNRPGSRARPPPVPPPPPARTVSATSTADQWAADPVEVTAQGRRLLGAVGVDVPDRHRPPDLGQGQGGLPADPRTSPGDQHPGARRAQSAPSRGGAAVHVLSPTLGCTPGSICERRGIRPGPAPTAPGRPRPSRHRWPGRPRPRPARRRGCSSCRPGTRG